MTRPLWRWSLKSVRDAIANREISPTEAVEAILGRIESRSHINAYITVLGERALAEARERERTVMSGGPLGPLFGVPIAIKDNIATAGARTTAGSLVCEHWTPDEDADVVRALRRAGAIIIGKNNLYEFAYGAAHPRFGETLNPWNLELTCGGSSNGSAAAVADGQGFASIGTDTGGSIRIPAAMCGIVGLKLTYGEVSNRGVIPVSPALDVVGPMTRSVEDAELMLRGMNSSFSGWATTLTRKIAVGVPRDLSGVSVTTPVAGALKLAQERLEERGFELREVDLPNLSLARDVMWTIASVDAAEYHRQYLKTRLGDYCEEVRRNLLGGTLIPAVDYVRAQRLRQRLAKETAEAFEALDVVLLPAVPIEPYRSGEIYVKVDTGVEKALPLVMSFTPLANLTGRPAIIVPVDAPRGGPPLTVQLYGQNGREDILLRVARMVERDQIHFPS